MRMLRCGACEDVLEVVYAAPPSGGEPRLPLLDPGRRISLGEGGTPLLGLPKLASELGLGKLRVKLEFQSATGSFKDRGSSVLISAAVENRVEEFVEDSSGNAGASLSAYAAAAGITAHVFAPASAAKGKLDQIAVFGATLHPIEGPRQAATDAAQAFVRERGLPYLSHSLSPYFLEGMKSFAYEVAEGEAAAATDIVLPVGNGSLLIGMFKGFRELAEAGRIDRAPRLHCVQSEAVRPLVAALNGEDWKMAPDARTVASGISVSQPPRLGEMVSVVRESGGSGVAVTDAAMLAWQRRLAASAGVFCEATSAAALAGLESLLASGAIAPGADVLVPLTGSGLKEPLAEA
jgi:threonine synthase